MAILSSVRGATKRLFHGKRKRVLAFDVLGTLVDLSPMRERIEAIGVPGGELEVWIARTLRDGMAREITVDFAPFQQVAVATLDAMRADHGHAPDKALAKKTVESMRELPLYPDAKRAVIRLRESGARLLAVTNGSRSATDAILSHDGVRDAFESIVSIDDVHHWKPHRFVYEEAARAAGVDVGELTMIAAHAWDVQGAARAGARTIWVRRAEARASEALAKADEEVTSFDEIVTRFTGAPARLPPLPIPRARHA